MGHAQVWTTQGFDSFARGSFGNAGQNLYVSRAGVLQRIFQFDLNKNGYVDLVFCNDHNHGESAPSYMYRDPMGAAHRTELPSDGAVAGTMADLNGNGYGDLVLGMLSNGTAPELNSVIYYGSSGGFSERGRQLLPVPYCISVAAGDFSGDGRKDLAFLRQTQMDSIENEPDPSKCLLRVFRRSALGYEPGRFDEFEIEADHIVASDLDGDGYDDLVVRSTDGSVTVYWGSPEGLDAEHSSRVPVDRDPGPWALDPHYALEPNEAREDARPLPKVVHLNGGPHIFVPGDKSATFVPVNKDRSFGAPLELACRRPMSVAVGNVRGLGVEDIVVACRETAEDGECSWIFLGGPDGYRQSNRLALPSLRACDVAVGDLDGDGNDEVVLCQNRTLEMYTTESLVYRVSPNGVVAEPARLTSEDARRVFLAETPSNAQPDVVLINRHSRNAARSVNSYVYFGGPEGYSPERRTEVPATRPVGAITCDINDNGYADLVFVNSSLSTKSHDSGCWVLHNGPGGFPAAPSVVLPTTRAHGVVCADLNRDGYLDLLFGGYMNDELLVCYGGADGFDADNLQRIRMEIEGITYDDVRVMCLADLNNDGWLDLVVPQVSSDRSFILWGGPAGFSMDRHQMLSVRHAGVAQAADLTGNGYPDLIVGGGMPSIEGPHNSFVYIYWNGPEGIAEDRRTLLPGNAVSKLGVADFNNDGLLDLLVCCYHAGNVRDIDSYIYWNRAGRGFSASDRTRLFTHSASGGLVADFNEDGWVDIAIAYHKIEGDHVGNSAVWWNGPDGFDESRTTGLPALGPHQMVVTDPGDILDRGPEEYYTSSPFEFPTASRVTSITWEAETPPKTWVKAQVRLSDSREGLESTPWKGPQGENSWFDRPGEPDRYAEPDRWVQYRLALGAVSGLSTPRVTRIDLHFDSP